MNTQPYQKAGNYGSMPSGHSLGSSENSPIPQTKRDAKKATILKAAVLVATLLAGILVGSAISSYSDVWMEEKEVNKQEQQDHHQQDATTSATTLVACDNKKDQVDNKSKTQEEIEAEQWAKIKEFSFGKHP